MSVQITSKMSSLKQVLLVICMLFFVFEGKAQDDAQKVYDSVMELSISRKEKINIFESEILQKNYTNTETHATVCYLVVKELCLKVDRASGIPFLKKELALRKKHVASNEDLIARTYNNLGNFYWYQKDYANVLNYHDSLVSYTTVKNKRCGNAYRVMADVYKKIGDYQRALTHYEQSETILKKVGAKDALLTTYSNKLSMYVEQEYGITKDDFRILRLKATKLADEIKAKDKKRLSIVFNSGAMLYHYKEYEASLKSYNKSLSIAENLKDSLRIAEIYTNMALIHVRKERINEALLINEKALLFVGNDSDQKSTIYDNLGDIYKGKQQHDTALNYYNKAVNELLPFDWKTKENLPEYERIIISPDRKNILSYLIDKQNVWLAYYEHTNDKKYLVAAEQTLQLIDKTIDYVYFESKEKISKLFWREEGAALYINAVKICFLLNKPAKAFYYIEKNKGVLLLDNISAFSAKRMAKLPQELIDKEYELQKKVKALEQKMISQTVQDSIKENYFVAKETYYKYVTSIEKEYPEYYQYRTSLPILSTKSVQETLEENEVVIAYILGEEIGYVLLMDQKTTQLYPLNNVSAFETELIAFQKLYAKPFETELEATQFQQQGNEIYQKILPFRNDSIYQKARKLIVIPDGMINSLPLEILPTNTAQDLHDAYLIQQKEISYCYSFSLDAQNELKPSKATSTSASFMLTKFKNATLTTLTVNPTELFDNATHINEKATKASFLKSYNEASEVYVSSHAGNTNDIPWLAMFDGKVYPNELLLLNNPKDLVVLNACKTSAGIFKEGEGVFSLTRAFLNSGSKSVVSSLWNLNETAGMEIFNTFRANLQLVQTKSEALQNAKLAYLEKYKNTSQSSPYYWGGIVITGNTDVLPMPFNKWKSIGLAVAGIIILFLYFRYRKRAY